ncbi:hypothetical protein [uncultured Methylobacterium sp.]|uniref:hypothetical protein n=1 Tax=uncultured Methylobacterium sp. TaxID=157278 RepID=UPI0035CBEEF4
MTKFRVVGQESGTEVEADEPRATPSLSGGNGGGTSDGMDRRVATLEKGIDKLFARLDDIQTSIAAARLDTEKRFGTLESRLIAIDTKLDAKVSTSELTPIAAKIGTIDGKVSNIPTVWQMIALMAALLAGVSGLAIAIVRLARP